MGEQRAYAFEYYAGQREKQLRPSASVGGIGYVREDVGFLRLGGMYGCQVFLRLAGMYGCQVWSSGFLR